MHVKSYTLDNRLLGVEKEHRGFSAYLYNRNNPYNHCVIGQYDSFRQLRIYMATVVFALPIVLAIVLPFCTVGHHETIRRNMMNEDSNNPYYVWATVIVLTIFNVLVIILGVQIIINGVQKSKSTGDGDVTYYYIFGAVTIPAIPIVNGIVIILAAIHKNVLLQMRQKPIPCLIPLCNHKTCSFIAFFTGSTIIMCTIQIMCPYGVYIIIALFASPLHTFSFLFLYVVGIYVLVVCIALFLKAFHTNKGSVTVVAIGGLFIPIIITIVIIIIIFFMKMMIVFGEYNNSGGILSFIGSVAPTMVLAVLGRAGNKALEWFGHKQKDDKTALSTLNDKFFGAVNRTVMITYPRKRITPETPV